MEGYEVAYQGIKGSEHLNLNSIVWLLFSFRGRIRRIEYWAVSIIIGIIILLPAYVVFEPYSEQANIYVDIMAILLLWPSLAIQAKRWHDRDKSAWWILINLVPVIGFIWAIIENGFLKGTAGSNRFGEPRE